MSVEDYEIVLDEDKIYDTPIDQVENISYGDIKKQDVVDKTTATSVASSYNVINPNKSKKEDPPMTKKCGIVLTSLMALTLIIVASVALATFVVHISKLRSDVASLQSTSPGMETTLANNFTTTLIIQAVESIMDARFSELNDQLSADVTRSVLNASANLTRLDKVNQCLENIDDRLSITFIHLVISKTTGNTNSLAANFIKASNEFGYSFASCAAILQLSPSSPSGYYYIRSSTGSAVHVYCDMTRSCGSITGGWMRVAELDMTDNTTQCPSSFELLTSPLRTCRIRSSSSGVCSSVTFAVGGVGYSKVCGRIRGYQVGTTDAFGFRRSTNIDTTYVDGVSLTYGTSPRQHIWTFASALSEGTSAPHVICPCINTAISSGFTTPPSFVGEDYFCDTATVNNVGVLFYAADPLWDGAGCGPLNRCCSFNTPPWFYKQLPQSTTDDIEMRVCRDGVRREEDIVIEVVDIYVQ